MEQKALVRDRSRKAQKVSQCSKNPRYQIELRVIERSKKKARAYISQVRYGNERNEQLDSLTTIHKIENPIPRTLISLKQIFLKRKQRNAYEITGYRKASLDSINFKLFDSEISIPIALKKIVSFVEHAKEILDFDDSIEGEPTDEATFKNSIFFFTNSSRAILEKTGKTLPNPAINILEDGSIYLRWETSKGKLLIIFKKNAPDTAYYYSEEFQSKVPTNSMIVLEKPLNDSLLEWMANYLIEKNEIWR